MQRDEGDEELRVRHRAAAGGGPEALRGFRRDAAHQDVLRPALALAAGRRVEGADVATILPAIAAGGNGCVAILYLQLGSPDVLRGARYRTVVSTDGGRTFTGGSLGTSFDLSRAPRIKGDVLVPSGYFVGDYLGLAPLGGSRFGAAFVVTTAARANPTVLLYAAFGSGA